VEEAVIERRVVFMPDEQASMTVEPNERPIADIPGSGRILS
jgi:hypothetical protein